MSPYKTVEMFPTLGIRLEQRYRLLIQAYTHKEWERPMYFALGGTTVNGKFAIFDITLGNQKNPMTNLFITTKYP